MMICIGGRVRVAPLSRGGMRTGKMRSYGARSRTPPSTIYPVLHHPVSCIIWCWHMLSTEIGELYIVPNYYGAHVTHPVYRAWRDFSISKILVRIRLISSRSPISKHETGKKISRSRLEPWDIDKKSRSRLEIRDLENKILVLVSNLEIERDKILKSERTAFHLLVLFVRHW